jgi:oligopeptide/dipeptide ABC transporter ATP-binding protein
MAEPLISIRDFKVHFGAIRAVDGISLDILEGETLGLVGESGSGKTTAGRAILRLVKPSQGETRFRGQTLGDDVRHFRRRMQMIFQDPYSSLNPRMTVGAIIAEPMRVWKLNGGKALNERVAGLMEMVGLDPRFRVRYPHEFSGGQRQRIGIARALAAEPDFIVADEPIAALDVSIQAQILNLIGDLQQRLKLTLLFISHDLRAVHHISERIAVMYLGRIVELARAEEIYSRPLMPYTRALIASMPSPTGRRHHAITGELPSPANPPSGCHFRTRCPYALAACAELTPQLTEISPGHVAACIRISAKEPDIEKAAASGLGVQQATAT